MVAVDPRHPFQQLDMLSHDASEARAQWGRSHDVAVIVLHCYSSTVLVTAFGSELQLMI
jgi:hypothetical protein